MEGMIPFSLRHECPKCGNAAWSWLHCRQAGAAEYLLLTCQRCGYAVRMEPKDKAAK